MADNLNLNIDSYNDTDILNLFNSTDTSSRDSIIRQYNIKVKSLEDVEDIELKSKLQDFFHTGFRKILKRFNDSSLEQSSNKVFSKDPRVFETVRSSLQNTHRMHPEPEIVDPPINSTFPIQYPLGIVNPIEKKTTSEILSLDTIFRDLEKYPESSNFVYNLPNPVENVISMKLLSAEIPNIQYLFSSKQRNNIFLIKMYNGKYTELDGGGVEILVDFPPEGKVLEIVIPDGAPGFGSLISSIQSALNTQRNSFSFLQVGIDDVSGRFFFRFKTLVECAAWNNQYYKATATQNIYTPDNLPATTVFKMPSVKAGAPGTMQYDYLKRVYLGENEASFRGIPTTSDPAINSLVSEYMLTYEIDFNPSNQTFTRSLGWLLGFRSREWIDSFDDKKQKKIEDCPPEQIECDKPLYDPKEHTNAITYDNTFDRDNILFNGYVRANTAYGDNQQDYIYLYVNDFVGNYNDTLNAALYESFLARSLLARLQIKTSFYAVEFVENSNSNMSILEKQRNYFGPVNIKKLHIKLIDKYGNVIHIGNTNYSLTFQFDKLYSSIRN